MAGRGDFQALLGQTAHRGQPLPSRPWLVQMRWHDLVFCHWRVPAETVAARLPPGLAVDQAEGSAWLSTVHFGMTDVRLRGGLGIPGHTRLRELNVRTYVRGPDGTPGIWFATVDAESRPIVEAIRRTYFLPYLKATFTGDLPDLACRRTDRRGPPAAYDVGAVPGSDPAAALPGTLDHFLHERYVLFTASPGGRLLQGHVHHRPYPLQPVSVRVREASVLDGWPVDPRLPDRVAYSPGFPVIAWSVEAAARPA